MGKSSQRLKERIMSILEKGFISKIELHRKTGISRPSLDGYLREDEAIADLDALDKLADAIGINPWDLIKPENEPLNSHSIQDCLNVVTKAALASVTKSAQPEIEDPVIQESISLLSSLDETERNGVLVQLRMLNRIAAGIKAKKSQ